MAATLTNTIRFKIRDYSTIDGGGYAVINRPDRCDYRVGQCHRSGWHLHHLYMVASSVEDVETTYRARWDVPVDVRYCACGCLRGIGAAARTIYHDLQAVTYYGSLTELHGPAYYCGPCWCRNENCTGAELETPSGQVISHASYDSFSPR